MDVLLRKFQEQYSALNSQTARPSREFVEQEYQQAQREYERATRQLSEYLNQNKDIIQSQNQTGILLQSIKQVELQLYGAADPTTAPRGATPWRRRVPPAEQGHAQ
jgi:intergrase/recombinase